jgi:hypothetical protein
MTRCTTSRRLVSALATAMTGVLNDLLLFSCLAAFVIGVVIAAATTGTVCDRDAPAEYGPPKTSYNRFVRCSRMGVFNKIFAVLAAKGGKPDQLMIDATYLKAPRTALPAILCGTSARRASSTSGFECRPQAKPFWPHSRSGWPVNVVRGPRPKCVLNHSPDISRIIVRSRNTCTAISAFSRS